MDQCEKRAFQLLKMRKKENQVKHKNQVRNKFLLTVRSSSLDYTCHYGVSTLKTKVYINFIINNENLEIFCLHMPGV